MQTCWVWCSCSNRCNVHAIIGAITTPPRFQWRQRSLRPNNGHKRMNPSMGMQKCHALQPGRTSLLAPALSCRHLMAFGSRSFVVRGWFPRQHVGRETSSKLNKKRKLNHDTGAKTLAASTRLHVEDPLASELKQTSAHMQERSQTWWASKTDVTVQRPPKTRCTTCHQRQFARSTPSEPIPSKTFDRYRLLGPTCYSVHRWSGFLQRVGL
jgi:hypothetical protein